VIKLSKLQISKIFVVKNSELVTVSASASAFLGFNAASLEDAYTHFSLLVFPSIL
jgi:hypothetical protein